MKEQIIDESKYQQHLFRILKFFISFCEENNLTYCCAAGTMLGAIRHHNIIPWDDDIDVFMPRRDYEKLLTLASVIDHNGFGVISAKITSSFATFAKLYDKGTTLWEIESIPFVYGVYIDIFPLDETSLTREVFLKKYRQFRNLFRKYQLSQMSMNIKRLFQEIKERDKKMVIKEIVSLFFPSFMSQYYRNKIIQFENSISLEEGPHLVSYYGDYWEKEFFDKKWFDSYVDVPFSDFKVKVPIGYHQYLQNVYGNYMEFPPIEKRVSHHYHYYLNMENRLSIDEILTLVK